ncbi:multicopper oxidase family protein [Bradyrhizobium sp. AZCC 1693]|uniref:multicopper oxidase family protein n=1 Tax=Bradyrhizobium sp. AZCC 1693 TaxID=3117029 RepID=UPI002FF3FA1F
MATISGMTLDRRSFLVGSASLAAALSLPHESAGAVAPPKQFTLSAAPVRVPLVGPPYPETDVWSYNSGVPGPEIRVRQGERLRIAVNNRLSQGTTIHWHGVRVPNAMDGVPHLTQEPIPAGDSFVYEFDVPDAGTYWYHPHHHSAEQVGRGLSGALIVEEIEPIPVDRDLVWVLGDWRLARDASIVDDFGNRMETTMAGRIGNTVTINGRVPESIRVRSGERLRLRLINAAPARIFGLEFPSHRPLIVALDGQPIGPHEPPGGRVVLGPAMRADLVLDMTGKPGATTAVVDSFYRDRAYRLVDFAYTDEPRLRDHPLDAPSRMRANTIPEPDPDNADRHTATLEGGMMSGRGMMMGMGMMGMGGMGWSINGVSAIGHNMRPMLSLARGRSYILSVRNETAWHHPVHLHGHSFRVIARNGKPTRHREWLDTVLVPPREQADIAFVADNPGDWMFHCHILDHQDGGMMAVIRVA